MKFKLLAIALLLILTAVTAYDHHKSPKIPSTGFADLDTYRASRSAIFFDDFGQLAHYREQNAALQPTENRVVFFGDSIIEYWKLADFFPGQPYVNRGIAGQTTSQMLVRFQQDVVALHPKAVVILASNNDIAGNTGPMRLEDSEANYASLIDMARANNIHIIFISMLPVHNYTEAAHDFYVQRPMDKIRTLNQWLKAYCEQKHIAYVDGFTAMLDEQGAMRKELADDGLHPTAAGYKLLAPLIDAAIKQLP